VTRQLKPGGILIIVDGFPEKRERPAIHVVKRSFKEYTSELENLNYKVTRIEHYQNCIVAEKRV
jgi:protein-L-isoaspartate O-methyltransferase